MDKLSKVKLGENYLRAEQNVSHGIEGHCRGDKNRHEAAHTSVASLSAKLSCGRLVYMQSNPLPLSFAFVSI